MISLAFIPPSDVGTAFDLVAGEFDDDVADFLDHLEKNWIGEPRKSGNFFFHYHLISYFLLFLEAGRKKAQFEHQLRNTYDRLIAGIPRSNNSVERCHNAFTNLVSVNHPNIIKLAEKIRREKSKFEIDIEKIHQGHQVKAKKNCYRQLDERIKPLVNAYDLTQLDQQLKHRF